MKTRKELKNIYKETKTQIGVFQITNKANGKILVGSSVDLKSIWNRTKTELKFGSHKNKTLQKDWIEFGEENFVFEIISEIKQDENGKQSDYRKQAKDLESMFLEELQPFDNKGYNVIKTEK